MTANNVNKQAEIIRRLKSGEGANLSQNKLAELFGVARSTIQLAMKKNSPRKLPVRNYHPTTLSQREQWWASPTMGV